MLTTAKRIPSSSARSNTKIPAHREHLNTADRSNFPNISSVFGVLRPDFPETRAVTDRSRSGKRKTHGPPRSATARRIRNSSARTSAGAATRIRSGESSGPKRRLKTRSGSMRSCLRYARSARRRKPSAKSIPVPSCSPHSKSAKISSSNCGGTRWGDYQSERSFSRESI